MKRRGANNTYFGNIVEGIKSSLEGLRLSVRHIWDARERRTPIHVADETYFRQETGIVTLEYPFETIPVPDNGRYRLHNEIDDCIVCDKCAEVCPVNCIEIEAVKSAEEIRKTSDGHSVRLYAAKFDIDMAKCCFCGLCTTVCPTECLTMTKVYDFSEFNVEAMNYHFSDLSPAEAVEKRALYEVQQQAKLAAKQAAKEKEAAEKAAANAAAAGNPESTPSAAPAKPVVRRPVVKPVIKKPDPPQS
jgi:formate hydrogenlyase subunit 6/NADH:ubiquinone oxidoreductase subunit I